MFSNLTIQQISKTFISALSKDKLSGLKDTSVVFYDLTFLKKRIEDLINLFPPNTLHAIAIKSNPLTSILKYIGKLNTGLEAASLPELYLALKTGISPDKIVFDSPVKTFEEIEFALSRGIHINADSLYELKRISTTLKKTNSKSSIGVRINPQVGTGTISATSVAGEYSKFGVPIKEYRSELLGAFLNYDWLTGVHLHIGSQGIDVELLEKGIGIVYDFVKEANEKLNKSGTSKRINIFDIGGGLPVSYQSGKKIIGMNKYKTILHSKYPEIFSGKFRLITEFGRYIFANTGWAASRVEYVKGSKEINTLMIHLGADMFLRKAYNPEVWHHEISVLDKNGNLKKDTVKKTYNIAGPLCFAGDFVAKKVELPEVNEGDFIIIHDTGAYTYGMWSRYNSRQMPKVLGYYNDGENFKLLKERETEADLFEFWS